MSETPDPRPADPASAPAPDTEAQPQPPVGPHTPDTGDAPKEANSEPQASAARPSGRSRVVQPDRSKPADVGIQRETEVPPWERDDAPKGSTSNSLMSTDDNGKPVVSGPTHYQHLVDGRIVGSYGIGTHHTDADVNDGEPTLAVAHY